MKTKKLADEVRRLNIVLASIYAATDLKTARRRAYEGRTPAREKDITHE